MRASRPALFPLLLLLIASCGAPVTEPAAPPPLAAEPALESGVILGLRPLPANQAGTADARMRLVTQVVGAARGAGSPQAPGAVEVMIRLERSGRDVALIEPPNAWMRPGQRVRFTPGGRPALAPSGA